MAWLEIHQSLPTHRKTFAMADILDIAPVVVVGHMTFLWLWAVDNLPDGDIGQTSTRTLARVAGWGGGDDQFVNAMIEAGFIDKKDDGTLSIHNWDKYIGKLNDRREANTQRMRTARERVEPVRNTCATRAQHVSVVCGATVPNLTVPNLTVPKGREEKTPPEVSTTEIKDAEDDEDHATPNFNQANEGERLALQHQELMQTADSCWKLSRKDAKSWASAYSKACRVRPHDEIQALLAFAFTDKWWSQKSTNPYEFLLNITKIKFAMNGEAKATSPPLKHVAPTASNGSYFAPGSGWIGGVPPLRTLRENND